jgi:hypothetical protein
MNVALWAGRIALLGESLAMVRIPLLAFFLICGAAQAAEGSPLVVDCGAGVYFPFGTDCRSVSPKQLGDRAEQQAQEQRAWNAQQQEQQHAYEIQRAEEQQHIHQVRLEVVGAILLIVIVVIVLLLIAITRKRLAIGSFIARGIYAVSGFDVRKISERWDGYRRRVQEDRNQPATESTVVSVNATALIPREQRGMKKRGSSLVLLNIGRVLMWIWIINGVGHLLLGPPLIGPLQQPIYAFVCLIQIVSAIIFLNLMTKAVRRRKHTSAAASS